MPRINPGPRRRKFDQETRATPEVWESRLRVWIDIGGRNALGPGKLRLLEAIAATRSLSLAAKRLRMSYRLAWKHLKLIEEHTGLTIVEPRRGGRGGGGTVLTPQGRALLDAFRSFRVDVSEYAAAACRRHFSRWSPAPSDYPAE